MTYSKFLLTLCPFWQLLSMLCLKCCTHFCLKIALLNLSSWIWYCMCSAGHFLKRKTCMLFFDNHIFCEKKRCVFILGEICIGGRINLWFNLKFKFTKFRNVYRLIYIQNVREIVAQKIMANWNGNEYSKVLLWIW